MCIRDSRTGLFENPYLDLEESINTVGNPEFVQKGYESQLRSVVLLKNKGGVLPLKEKCRVYIPDRHIRPYRNFMSGITPEAYITPPGKKAAEGLFEVVDTPEEADAAGVGAAHPKSRKKATGRASQPDLRNQFI